MSLKPLPIGTDLFRKLRENNAYYVDKTPIIKEIVTNASDVHLFTRPRRFGKTLTMSMLNEFFSVIGDKSIFDGLAITEEKQICDAYMGKYPTVFVSFKDIVAPTFEGACGQMRKIIYYAASDLNFLMNSDRLSDDQKAKLLELENETASDEAVMHSLKTLCHLLNLHYGTKVILLIDEYDVPLNHAHLNGYYNEMVSYIRSMFGQALKTNPYLQFAVLTGCLRISKESIFTGLNNLKVHSITDVNYDECFGFTEPEVDELLAYYNLTDKKPIVKEWYDGYRFGNEEIYCPWDVINYCYDVQANPKLKPKTYWMNTSGNAFIKTLIERAPRGTEQMQIEKLIAGEPIRKVINEQLTYNEIYDSMENIWSLLFMTGYLTFTEEVEDSELTEYYLRLPNKEVQRIFVQQVMAWFKEKSAANTEVLSELYDAFKTGDTGTIKDILDEQLIDCISYHDAYESFYHGFLLALLLPCRDWNVTSNRETGKGRNDILIEALDKSHGIVIEIKNCRDDNMEELCDEALRQIEDRDYTAVLRRYRFKEIRTYGIAFWDKECMLKEKKVK